MSWTHICRKRCIEVSSATEGQGEHAQNATGNWRAITSLRVAESLAELCKAESVKGEIGHLAEISN